MRENISFLEPAARVWATWFSHARVVACCAVAAEPLHSPLVYPTNKGRGLHYYMTAGSTRGTKHNPPAISLHSLTYYSRFHGSISSEAESVRPVGQSTRLLQDVGCLGKLERYARPAHALLLSFVPISSPHPASFRHSLGTPA